MGPTIKGPDFFENFFGKKSRFNSDAWKLSMRKSLNSVMVCGVKKLLQTPIYRLNRKSGTGAALFGVFLDFS